MHYRDQCSQAPECPLQVVPSLPQHLRDDIESSFITTREDLCPNAVAIETGTDVAIGTATDVAIEPSSNLTAVDDELEIPPPLSTSDISHVLLSNVEQVCTYIYIV